MIDHHFLKSLRDVIGNDVKEIIQSYNGMLIEQVKLIDASFSNNNLNNARIHVHTLKGSSANVGATELSNFCLKLEELAKTNSPCPAMMPEINKIMEKEVEKEFFNEIKESFGDFYCL